MATIYSKTMTKTMAFQALRALAEEAGAEDLVGVIDYELERIAASAEKAREKRGGAVASTDRMASVYAGELAKALISVMTKEAQTANQLVEALAGKTLPTSGKEVKMSPWVSSCLMALAGTGKSGETITEAGKANINPNGVTVKETLVKTTSTNSKGLLVEKLTKAYFLA